MSDPVAGDPGARRGVRGLVRDLVDFDRRVLLILAYVPIAMVVIEYWFIPSGTWKRPLPAWTQDVFKALSSAIPSAPLPLWPYLWWAAGCLAVMVLVPMGLLATVAKTSPRETGLRLKGTAKDAPTYLLLFLVFAPVVWLVSRRADFQLTYPFYPRAPQRAGGDWVAFEVGYFLQFFAVEYFFRGVMVLGLKPMLGRLSILVMLAPYCMIHFHKPMLEAFGAIGAGVVLGSLSWRTGTIVYGWFLHYAVALSMDLLSLSQSGRL